MVNFEYNGIKISIFNENLKYQKNTPVQNRLSLGTYEKEEIVGVRNAISESDVVLDLGSSLGVTSCVIASLISDSSNLVAVEANPTLIENIKHNRDINNFLFDIKNAPVSYNNRIVNFNYNGLSLSGSIIRKKHLEGNDTAWGKYTSVNMETVTPLDLERQYNKKFTFLSCDIEGEEYDLLYYMFDYFKNFNAMVVEFHELYNDSKYNRKDIHQKYLPHFHITNIGQTSIFKKR